MFKKTLIIIIIILVNISLLIACSKTTELTKENYDLVRENLETQIELNDVIEKENIKLEIENKKLLDKLSKIEIDFDRKREELERLQESLIAFEENNHEKINKYQEDESNESINDTVKYFIMMIVLK